MNQVKQQPVVLKKQQEPQILCSCDRCAKVEKRLEDLRDFLMQIRRGILQVSSAIEIFLGLPATR